MKKSQVTIIAIERALRIIEILFKERKEMGIVEIATKIGESQSTVYRAVATLEGRGFIYQNSETNKYALGLKFCSIGIGIKHDITAVSVIAPYAKKLSKEFSEVVNIMMRDFSNTHEYNAILIHQESQIMRSLGPTQILGSISSCFSSASGKVLLAFADDYAESRIAATTFVKLTKNTIVDPIAFIEELKTIRKLGYALDNEEQEKGLFCVGCPILEKNSYAKFSISISGLTDNMKAIGVVALSARLKEVANEISTLL